MKRLLMLIAFASLLFGLPAASTTVRAQGDATAHATQHPINQSGVMGRITFTQIGTGLMVTGTATGLVPNTVGRYVTLVYDVGSVPGGPNRCEPSQTASTQTQTDRVGCTLVSYVPSPSLS